MISTGPHEFKPIRFWDRWKKQGRCRTCYLPKFVHPIKDWTIARPLRDKQKSVNPGPRRLDQEDGFRIDRLF